MAPPGASALATALIDAVCLRVAPAAVFAPILLMLGNLVGGGGAIFVMWLCLSVVAAVSASIGRTAWHVTRDAGHANLASVMILAVCITFGGLLTRGGGEAATADIVEFQEASFIYHAWAAMMVSEFTALPSLHFNPEGYGDGIRLSGSGFLTAYGLDPDGLALHLAALGGIAGACVLCELVAAVVCGGAVGRQGWWGRAGRS